MNPLSNISSSSASTSSPFSTLSEPNVDKQVSDRVLELREKIEEYKVYKSRNTKNAKDALGPLFQEISQILNNPTFDIIVKPKGKSATPKQAQEIINRQKDYKDAPIKQQVINYRDKSKISFFADLCQQAPLEIIKLFTPDKITEEINCASNEGWTPLQRAILGLQDSNVIAYLIEKGAKVNQINLVNQFSPLHIALMHTVVPKDKAQGERICTLLKRNGARLFILNQKKLPELEEAYQKFEMGLNNEQHERVKAQSQGSSKDFEYASLLTEKQKKKFFEAVKLAAASELNAAIDIEKEGKKKSNIPKLLAVLQNSADKEEISNLPINGELPFHKACLLLKEAVIKGDSTIDRCYSIVQQFIDCGASLTLEIESGTGAEIQKTTALNILASEDAAAEARLDKYRKKLEKYEEKHKEKTERANAINERRTQLGDIFQKTA